MENIGEQCVHPGHDILAAKPVASSNPDRSWRRDTFCMFLYFQVSSVMWDVALTRSQAALDGCVALWPDYDGQQQIAVYSINPLSTKGSGQQL